ncbi:lytic murein transglycosylase [Deferribacter autotrophicus]|uniref:Lytic murein transglycosylase n=1 Tax=Deferribacter autotrophicus TaxID=500465 RepID=A0A5A8F1I5_9BACT|nr:lytic murein transglycosylase [Deferribacter autotrophicus]KAA0257970.1 lytic murein transglycosylase [Deferribacter autotrophicus]
MIYILLVFLLSSTNLFAENLVLKIKNQFNIPENYIVNSLKKASIDEKSLTLIKMPKENLPFNQYKKLLLTKKRIVEGKKFLKKYNSWLVKSEKIFKVDKNIITAIIGIESFYGKHRFNHKTLNVLYTLSTYFKKRADYFTNELGNFLSFCFKNKLHVESILSSYAGAIGIPQFMPSNVIKYGIDFNKNGKIDIIKEIPDAIGSVANYLHKFGWNYKKPTAIKVNNAKKSLLNRWMTVKILKRKGVSFPFQLKPNYKAKIIKIDNSYWAVFNNFYVLRKYNPSNNYVLTVLILSKKIR